MKIIITSKSLFFYPLLFIVFLFSFSHAYAQAPTADTIRVIQILQGKSLREKKVDSATSYQTIAGDVIMKEGLTLFSCDSAAINKNTNVMEAFGNIHINQQDSIHTYSQYLRYVGAERVAYLKKDVRLTDKKGTLYTQELEYDLKTNIGKYKSGGRVVNGKTILTSDEGTYYGDTKDVFFKKDVHLVDPKYDIRSDSMQYNTQTQLATFVTETFIKSKEGGNIYTTNGTYDLKNGKAFFGSRSIIKDSTRTYVADNSAYDETSGIAQLEGNAVIKDSVNAYSILGGQIFVNKINQSFLATRKPVLIFKGEGKDSTFIAADTLFSGIERYDSLGNKIEIRNDTLKKTVVINNQAGIDSIQKGGIDSIQKGAIDSIPKNDSLLHQPPRNSDSSIKTFLPGKHIPNKDSIQNKIILPKDSTINIAKLSDTVVKKLSDTIVNNPKNDSSLISIKATNPRKDITLIKEDSTQNLSETEKPEILKKKLTDSVVRYFLAFHHVRIFNDSLQAVCDSLYYTSLDSVFRLYQDPIVFTNKTQIMGDTINLFTKNKKAERIYVFDDGIIINQVNSKMYNQMGGRTLNGYFVNGAIDYMRVKGSPAESVYYPQDDDSAFTGMNRCKGDVIDIYFVDKAVNKVKFINDVDGTLFPIRQIPEDQKYLQKFKWLDSRRPKNKLELFE